MKTTSSIRGVNQSKEIKTLRPILYKSPFINAEQDRNKETNSTLIRKQNKLSQLKTVLTTCTNEYSIRFLTKRIATLKKQIESIQDNKKCNPITRGTVPIL
jgi:hypothetical protein